MYSMVQSAQKRSIMATYRANRQRNTRDSPEKSRKLPEFDRKTTEIRRKEAEITR